MLLIDAVLLLLLWLAVAGVLLCCCAVESARVGWLGLLAWLSWLAGWVAGWLGAVWVTG